MKAPEAPYPSDVRAQVDGNLHACEDFGEVERRVMGKWPAAGGLLHGSKFAEYYVYLKGQRHIVAVAWPIDERGEWYVRIASGSL